MIVIGSPVIAGDRYAEPGSPILGSRYFRNYCSTCGEPLRVAGLLRHRSDLQCNLCGVHRRPRQLERAGAR